MNFQSSTVMPNAEDYLQSTAVFSGIKKTILSKDFKGGKVSNIFGSTELDFTNADLTGTAMLDISQAFGEVTITVPTDWRIEADLSQLMAVVDDFRNNTYLAKNSDKVLILKGISFCGNVEIMN
ncbi:MAG TPA: LiaF domain-containing protein [Mucilaginibacter sp.]|jgi:predicted membrane protein|nr:LiaF domain-containing protein [Mucilaginibacter sp.]